MSVPRILTIMGSGETTPTMARVHRAVLERLGERPVPAVVLDTPYGFQENADEISARAVDYFRESVGYPFSVARLRGWPERSESLETETALARIREARLVFAGPGSPSYALRVWNETSIPALIAEKLATGGAVTVASAAALTIGRVTIPVYEIYKAGEEVRWLPGLDLLGAIGLPAAVVPHYDNAEGGTHDTRYCYMGERRLEMLEAELPDDVFILGVDGHTALVLDLDAGTASVLGLGRVTVRMAGRSTVFESGAVVPIAALREAASGPGGSAGAGSGAAGSATERPPVGVGPGAPAGTADVPLRAEVRALEADFDAAVAARDAGAAVRTVLALEATIVGWSRDTEQSRELDDARSALRAMIVRLGELAEAGTQDPAETVGPFVDALIDFRLRARESRDWATADAIRERLVAAGIEVHDAGDGTTWELRAAERVG